MVKIYHNIIKDCLKELSDKSFQDRVWTGSSPSEMSSFTEAAEQLYGGTGLHFAYKQDQPVYGEEVDNLLKKLRTTLKGIPINRHPVELVQDEKMIPVRKMAADILNKIEQKEATDRLQNKQA